MKNGRRLQAPILISKDQRPHPALVEYFTYGFYKLAIVLKSNLDSELKASKSFNLWSIHLGILRLLSTDGPHKSQKELCEELGVDKASMVSLIEQLIDKKMITQSKSPEDRRTHQIKITNRGKLALKAGTDIRRDIEIRFLKNLSGAEQAMLREIISKLLSDYKNI